MNSLGCEQNMLGELDGIENPCCRQDNLMHQGTCHGAPLQTGHEKRDEDIKTKEEELKCNRFVLGFQTAAVFRL